MGIQGLLPFVQKATRQANIKEFSGKTAAVDTYCWLHKGAFSCAERLVKGESTDAYVTYCMKMADLLIMSGVRPILVFDGRHLPSKKLTEKKRRQQREINRQKAKQFLIEGKIQEARECYQRAVDVTSAMAHEVIKECRRRGIDYIVAPYEADAQLAYLAQCKLADVVITEDSDLILFGCDKVLFKMDRAGFGVLYEKSELGKCFGLLADRFTLDKFRQMCILSGCDYLPSLPGIGLKKANKFFSLITNPNLRATLPKLPSYLKMPTLSVDNQYVEQFLKAENTFRYQLVFCPDRNELVPLNPYDPSIDPTEMTYAGQQFPKQEAFDLAIGNIDVNTGQKVDNYVPKDGKILRARSSLGNVQDQKEKVNTDSCIKDSTPKRLGAFEVAERRLAQTSKTPKTQARFLHRPQKPLTSLENIDAHYDKQESPLPSFDGNSRNNESPVENTTAGSSPKSQDETGNIFKVTPKPRVVRSRFFSTPTAPASPEKELTEWQRQLSEPVCDSGPSKQNKASQGNASLGKFQWSSRFVPQGIPTTPVSKHASTPFKRLRLSVSALEKEKRNSCVLGDDAEDEEMVIPVEKGRSTTNQPNQLSKTQDSGFTEDSSNSLSAQGDSSVLTPTNDSQQTKGAKSLFEVLDERDSSTVSRAPRAVFKNPFAKVPRSPPTAAGDLVIPDSDEEDPLPPSFRELSKQTESELSLERWQDELSANCMADSLEESVESPIPKPKLGCNSFGTVRNSWEDLDCPNSLNESPWPVTEKTELGLSVTGMVEESDDDELIITSAFIVKRPTETPKYTAVKPRIPSKPSKKAPPKQRRLGLSKSTTKRDGKQQSLLESLAKFHFKKSSL